jgi:hypothetical protein
MQCFSFRSTSTHDSQTPRPQQIAMQILPISCMKTEQAAQRWGSSLLLTMPLRGWDCWIPVRVVRLLRLVGGAAAIFDQTGATTNLDIVQHDAEQGLFTTTTLGRSSDHPAIDME